MSTTTAFSSVVNSGKDLVYRYVVFRLNALLFAKHMSRVSGEWDRDTETIVLPPL